MSDRIEAIRARHAAHLEPKPDDVAYLLDAYRHMVESWETLEDVKAEALEHAADEANRRREKYLESPSLSMDWVAGWHAAVDDVTATLRALAPVAPDAEPTEPCSCGSRDAYSLTPGEWIDHQPDACRFMRATDPSLAPGVEAPAEQEPGTPLAGLASAREADDAEDTP